MGRLRTELAEPGGLGVSDKATEGDKEIIYTRELPGIISLRTSKNKEPNFLFPEKIASIRK